MVSIVIPVYNAEKYLKECLDSIVSQTYNDLEIICVDDGSTDLSVKIINEYKQRDERIVLIQQPHLFAGTARNKGLDAARGDYIIFLDSDDYFITDMIESMVSKADSLNADISICGVVGLNEKTGKQYYVETIRNDMLPREDCFSPQEVAESIFQMTGGWAFDKLYKTEFVRRNKIRFQKTEAVNDLFFVDALFSVSERIVTITEKKVIHRMNVQNSITNKSGKNRKMYFEALCSVQDYLNKKGLYEIYEKSFINRAASYINWNLKTISDILLFNEFFLYCKNEGINKLGLWSYDKEFFYNEDDYDMLEMVKKSDESEMLGYVLKSLNKDITELMEIVYLFESEFNRLENANHQMRKWKKWILPEKKLVEGDRIAIYGYGDVGHDLSEEITNDNRYKLCLILDNKFGDYTNEVVTVRKPEDINSVEFDKIIIAILDCQTVKSVSSWIESKGIDKEKIVLVTD